MRPGLTPVFLFLIAGVAQAEVDLATFRPHPRPASGAVPTIRPIPRPMLATAQPFSQRPMRRPDFQAQTIALPPVPQKPAKGNLTGSVCQRPEIMGKALPPIKARNKGCSVADPVLVSEISGVKLVPPATINCEEAKALSTWVTTGLQPAFDNTVVRINVADSYACRPRNNVPGNPVSVHGLGQAIDIGGFLTSGGRTYTVADNYGSQIKAAQKAGCGIFHTILGPGSDGYHESHLHFDVARHGGGDYCH